MLSSRFAGVLVTASLSAPLLAQNAPVATTVDITCLPAAQGGGVKVECAANDVDDDLNSIIVSILVYPTEADCLAGTNQIGIQVGRLINFSPRNAASKFQIFDCEPGLWYRGEGRPGDATGRFDVMLSPNCCSCIASPDDQGAELNGDPENDTPEGAENAFCGREHYGTIQGAGDVDYWAFTLFWPSRVAIWTAERGAGTPSMTDTQIDLLGTDGVTIFATNDDEFGALGEMSLLDQELPPGTYYVCVRGAGGDTGAYQFDIFWSLLFEFCEEGLSDAPPESEPNDSCAQADPTDCCAEHTETLQSAGDTDFYCLSVLPPGADVVFETIIDASTTGTALSDTRLWLYDSACVEIDSDDDGGAGLFSLLEATLEPGVYYVEISDWQRGRAGDYRLTVACGPPSPPGGNTGQRSEDIDLSTPLCASGSNPAPSESEPNDTCGTADDTSCCDEHTDALQFAGDTDFYCLSLSAQTIVTFATVPDGGVPGTSLSDSKLWLYDSGCVEIASNDDGGPGLLSLIEIELPPGVYYIEVSHWQRNDTGTYELTVECTLPAPECIGATCGVELRMDERVGERPHQQTLVTTDVTGTPPGAVVLLGFDTPIAPSIDLGLIGAPGCPLAVAQSVPAIPVLPTAPCEAEFSLEVGGLPPGLEVFVQAAAIDIGSNPLGVITSTNVLVWTVGNEFE